MKKFDFPDEFGGISTCEDVLLEVQNAHKITQNMRNSSDITELSAYVNHLVFLHVHRLWTGIVPLENSFINIPELGKSIRWHGFFIKKLQSKKRSVYYVNRWDGDIIYWRTQTLIDDYSFWVYTLLKASSVALRVTETMIKTLKELPEETEEV